MSNPLLLVTRLVWLLLVPHKIRLCQAVWILLIPLRDEEGDVALLHHHFTGTAPNPEKCILKLLEICQI